MKYVCRYKILVYRYCKKLIVVFIVCLLYLTVSSQKASAFNWDRYLSNESVKFRLLFVSPSAVSKKGPPVAQYVVSILMTNKERERLRKMDTAFWYSHLNDTNTDFATSLMLHHLYHEDAGVFINRKTREQWLPAKEADIEWWKAFFRLSKNRHYWKYS